MRVVTGEPVVTAFDTLAVDYDRTFTDTDLGRLLRARVWNVLDRAIAPGSRVLELNCGTGEDAIYLSQRGMTVVATDVAREMVDTTRAKVAQRGVARVEVRQLAIEDVGTIGGDAFDAVLSNFGGLNCVDDLHAVAADLAQVVRPGGSAVLVLMGPVVPWEWAWYLSHGQPTRAFRRLRGPVEWRGITVHYPSIRSTTRAFEPHFQLVATEPIGVAIPPTYAEPWLRRHPRLLERLDSVDRGLSRVPGAARIADHYLVHLERR
jgi:SAM-dependent methyltransferase